MNTSNCEILLIVKPKANPDENSRKFEEIVIPLEKREEILNELGQVLQNGTLKNT